MATKLLAGTVLILSCVILFLLVTSSEDQATLLSLEAPQPVLPAPPESDRSLEAAISDAARAPVAEDVSEVTGASTEAKEEEPPTPADPLAGIVSYYLGDGVMERQMVIDERLAQLTEFAFAEQWESGVIYNIDDMGPTPYEDDEGRPRPCEVRRVGGGSSTMVILPEEQYPKVWLLMQAKKDIMLEMRELKRAANLRSKKKS